MKITSLLGSIIIGPHLVFSYIQRGAVFKWQNPSVTLPQHVLHASTSTLHVLSSIERHQEDLLHHVDQLIQIFDVNDQKTEGAQKKDSCVERIYFPDSDNLILSVDLSHRNDIQFCTVFQPEIRLPFNQLSKQMDHEKFFAKPTLSVVQTKEPILSCSQVEVIRSAAQAYWTQPNNSDSSAFVRSSRFTYQRKGNYEAHLVDLVPQNPLIKDIIDESLHERIYPLVRKEFSRRISDLDYHKLCLYDALVIRYNATEAAIESDIGAGQPLHRDLGLVSVNIMLNPSSDFTGGGTFFENQLLDEIDPMPLKPVGVGHALMHLSSDRHAGASTTKGIREILVIFLTAMKDVTDERRPPSAPDMERSARLKSSARSNCNLCSSNIKSILCRILHYRLALQYSNTDGEAWHYLGTSLGDLYKEQRQNNMERVESTEILPILESSVSCLRHALRLLPCDSRLCNNLALALETLCEYYDIKETNKISMGEVHEQIISAYERSLLLHKLSVRAGCDVAVDYDSACLNYGLYISKRDMFEQSAHILEQRFGNNHNLKSSSIYSEGHETIRRHGRSLLEFCSRRS